MSKKYPALNDGDTFTHGDLQFIVSFEYDDDATPPWERADGHGPVSDWTSRDKKPGEWVLSSNRGFKHFYDAAEATRIAKRDGWGIGKEARAELAAKLGRAPTKGEVTAEAVRRDFEFLRGWCTDEWHYVGVCVRHVSQDADQRYIYALWGIESESADCLTETAHDLAGQCADTIRADIATQGEALKTIRATARDLIRDIRASATLRPAICAAVRAQLAAMLAQRSAAHARISELTA